MNALTFLFYKIAGGIFTPPGCFFVLLFGLLLRGLIKTKEKATRRIYQSLFVVVAILYVLFMPVTAEFLMGFLEVDRPLLPDDDVPTLVAVLAGGGTHSVPGSVEAGEPEIELAEQSFQRFAGGISIARRRNWPLVYSGAYDEGDADSYAKSLQALARLWGMEEKITVEGASRTTWENLREIARIVEADGIKRLVVSTTAYHMKRALWMAKRQMPEIEIVPWPSGWRGTRDRLTINAFGPSARAFYDCCTALRELAGLTAYRILR